MNWLNGLALGVAIGRASGGAFDIGMVMQCKRRVSARRPSMKKAFAVPCPRHAALRTDAGTGG